MKNLKQNIEAANLHTAAAKKYYLKALNQASALIGKKVKTAAGDAAKLWTVERHHEKKQVNGCFLDTHTWFEFTSGSIWINIKTCYNGGSWDTIPTTAFCIYIDSSMYLGEVKDGILTATANEEVQKSWLNTLVPVKEAKILKDIEKYKKAQDDAKNIYNSIPEHFRKLFYLNR